MTRFREISESGDVILSELLMRRSASNAPTLLVEGHTDTRLFRRLLNPDCGCLLKSTAGKDVAIWVAEHAEARQLNAAAIVDADDDLCVSQPRQVKGTVFQTDLRDIEAMAFCSAAGDILVDEYFSGAVFKQVELAKGHSVKTILIDLAAWLGAARVTNRELDLGINFDALNYMDFVEARACSINTQMLALTLRRATQKSISSEEMHTCLGNWRTRVPAEKLVPGHDLGKIMAIVLNDRRHENPVFGEDLLKSLRAIYGIVHFQDSTLHARMSKWGSKRGYEMFR